MALVSFYKVWLLLEVLGPSPQVLLLRILVHTLGKLYLPPSLLRDGCVTQMCMGKQLYRHIIKRSYIECVKARLELLSDPMESTCDRDG